MGGVLLVDGDVTRIAGDDTGDAPPPADHLRVRTTHVLVDEADRRAAAGRRWLGAGAVGDVTETGPDVDESLVGTRVLVTGPAPCGRCATCRRGQPHLCLDPTRDAAGTRGIGGARTQLTVAAGRTTPVPSGLSAAAATLLGGAALTGAAAVRSAARLVPGERVAVVGDVGATVGALVARAAGARLVVALPTTRADGRVLAAHGIVTATDAEELAARAEEATDGTGLDAVVAIGAPATLLAATVDVVRPGGSIVVVDPVDQVPRLVVDRGRTLVDAPFGAADPQRDLPWLVPLALDGAVPLDGLLSPGEAGLAAVAAAVRSDVDGTRTVHALP